MDVSPKIYPWKNLLRGMAYKIMTPLEKVIPVVPFLFQSGALNSLKVCGKVEFWAFIRRMTYSAFSLVNQQRLLLAFRMAPPCAMAGLALDILQNGARVANFSITSRVTGQTGQVFGSIIFYQSLISPGVARFFPLLVLLGVAG